MSQAHGLQLELTREQQECLFALVRSAIEAGLEGKETPRRADVPVPPAGTLHQPMGAFVTLHKRSRLRGCIGMMRSPDPLYLTVAGMAWAAAFNDQRFPPLQREEWPDISFDISILGPMSLCPDINRIALGRHGLMLELGARRGVFLPQVPVEQGWNLPTTLEQLGFKAGLSANAWKDSRAKIYWYESLLITP